MINEEKQIEMSTDQEKQIEMSTDQEKQIEMSTDQEKQIEMSTDQEKQIEFLEIQLKESYKKILEQTIISERDIKSVRARSNKDIENARKFSLEKLIMEFLPIFDNIERAVDLIEKNKSKNIFDNILIHLKNTCNSLEEIFTMFNIKKINNVEVSFDPSIHQAMSIHYTNEIKSNQIVQIVQTGYILNESRLLRPAMVVVSKKQTSE